MVILAAFCVSGLAQSPVTLSLDPVRSSATMGGHLIGIPIQEQGAGSLTTSATGPISGVMSRLAFTFTGGAADLSINGTWQPGIGGGGGSAPGDAGLFVAEVFFMTDAYAAARDVVFATTSGTIAVSGTGYDSTAITFAATTGFADYRGDGLFEGLVGSGSVSMAGSSGLTEDSNGLLVIENGICTLTIPIELSIVLDALQPGDSLATYDGMLVATGAVPPEAIMAYNPDPTNGAAGVLPGTMLNWSSAYYAASHQVYVGTDATQVSNATIASAEYKGNPTEATFDPAPLGPAASYFWRIDEVAPGGAVTRGDVWSFTTPAMLPFAETFEAGDPGMAGTVGSLHGQHGWEVTPADGAIVQNTEAHGGSQACRINAATVSHTFVDSPKRVQLRFYAKPTFSQNGHASEPDCAVAFWVDASGHIAGYDGAIARTSTAVTLTEDTWVRFDLHLNYHAQQWSLWANGTPVATDFGFHGVRAAFEAFRIRDDSASPAYLDDVRIAPGPYGLLLRAK